MVIINQEFAYHKCAAHLLGSKVVSLQKETKNQIKIMSFAIRDYLIKSHHIDNSCEINNNNRKIVDYLFIV